MTGEQKHCSGTADWLVSSVALLDGTTLVMQLGT